MVPHPSFTNGVVVGMPTASDLRVASSSANPEGRRRGLRSSTNSSRDGYMVPHPSFTNGAVVGMPTASDLRVAKIFNSNEATNGFGAIVECFTNEVSSYIPLKLGVSQAKKGMGARLGSVIAFRPRVPRLFAVKNVTRILNEQFNSRRRQKRQASKSADKTFSHNDHSMDTLPTNENIGEQHILHESQDNIVHHEGSLVFRIGNAIGIKDKFYILMEFPSFYGPEPQPLVNSPSLDVSLGDIIGPEPPIKIYSLNSSRMKVVYYLTTQTPPSPYVANSHPKGVYTYYNACIDDLKKHYGFKSSLLGQSRSLGVDFLNMEMIENDFRLESKEVSPLEEELSLFDRPNKIEINRILEAHHLESILQQKISQHIAPYHYDVMSLDSHATITYTSMSSYEPLPAAVSPTAESPGYITDSEPKMEPEEEDGDDEKSEGNPIDYPTNRGDDADDDGDDLSEDDADDEDEDESSNKEGETAATPPPSAYRVVARISVRPHIPMPFHSESEVERLLAIPTPSLSLVSPTAYPLPPFIMPLPIFTPLLPPPPIILPRTTSSMVLMRSAAPSTFILAPRSRAPPIGTPPLLPMHDPLDWKLYDTCGVHHVSTKDQEIFMLVEMDYPSF
nr:hypothetical protein [Tanacetum cinerariifolium]